MDTPLALRSEYRSTCEPASDYQFVDHARVAILHPLYRTSPKGVTIMFKDSDQVIHTSTEETFALFRVLLDLFGYNM